MQKLKIIGLILAIFGIFICDVQAGELTKKIQEQYKNLKSLETEFTQTLTNAASGSKEVRTGKIYFKRPGLIRWQTSNPEKELIILDESFVWDYISAEKTVYKYELEQKFQSKTMLNFITGNVNLTQDFKIDQQGKEVGWEKIRLVPKNPEPNLVLAYIWIEPETYLLRRILLIDFFGNGNQLNFKNLKINVQIEKEKFNFDPPEDVEIIQNRDVN